MMDPHSSKNEVVVADKLSNFEHRTYLQRLQRCFGSSRRTSNVLRKVSALRIRGSSKSTHVISEEVMTTDMPISNGYCIKGGDMVEKKDGEVKMVGFRPKSKIPPEDESRQATISPQAPPSSTCLDPSSLLHQTSFSSPSNEHSLANRESSLRLSSSQRRSSLTHSTTSRRGSQITSEAAGVSSRLPSSMRRRSLVGPIGLRTRTPSMNQRRGSQRTGTIEQLPFVVRWIIANKEAEEKELAESTHSIYDRESAMDERMKDASVQSEFRPSARKRHCSDSTQAPDITSILSTPRDMVYGSRLTAFSHSPSVSFPGKSPVAPTNRTPGNLQRLYRISSNSLPELDQIVDARTSGRQSILTPRPGLLKQDLGGHPPDLRVQFEESPLASVLGRPSTLNESIEEVEAEEYEDEEEMEGEGEEEEGEEGEMGEEDEEEDAFMRWASKGMWHHLVYSLCPIDIGEWKKISIPMKILQILQAPIFLLFRLTIPVVIEDLEPAPPATTQATETVSSHDLEAASIQGAAGKIPEVTVSGSKLSVTTTATESQISFQSSDTVSTRVAPATSEGPDSRTDSRQPSISENSDGLVDFEQLHGWCRLLNCFQCLLTPMLWVMLITIGGTSAGLHKIGNTDMPAVVIVLLISTCLAITIFVTSKWDRPPTPYHRPFFATLGFLTSVIWIYAIAHELVNSLETLGIVWEISEAILGISVMALASSIGGEYFIF
nr:unnamed protein product [Spirometra erinaceieuropaei]